MVELASLHLTLAISFAAMPNNSRSVKQAAAIDRPCPSSQTLALVGRKWSGPLLATLHGVPHRHGELLRRLRGLSAKVLQQELRLLVDAGLAERFVVARKPLEVEYRLTDRGAALTQALQTVDAWVMEEGLLKDH